LLRSGYYRGAIAIEGRVKQAQVTLGTSVARAASRHSETARVVFIMRVWAENNSSIDT